MVRGGFLVSVVHGDTREEGTCAHRTNLDLLSLVVFAIPTLSAGALVAADPVSLYPRDSVLCLFIFDSTMRDKGPQC